MEFNFLDMDSIQPLFSKKKGTWISCALRLGATICHPHQCICGEEVDSKGRHGLACRNQMGRKLRHDQVNDLIKRNLVQAKIPAVTEPKNLSRDDGKTPDGLTLTTWKQGKCLIYDVTIADTVCNSYVNQCSKNPGSGAEIRETNKISKYKKLANDYCFVPVGIETFGSWGSEGHKLIKTIGRKVMEVTNEKRSSFFLFQAISMAIQRGNAICVIGTFPQSKGFDEVFEFLTNSTDQEDSS